MNFTSLVDILRERAKNQYNENIYSFLPFDGSPDLTLTYGQLYEKANSIAHELLLHVRQGDRALLLYPSGLEFIEAFFACLLAGIVAVPAYPPRKNHNTERLQSVIEDCEAKVVLTSATSLKVVETSFKEGESLKGFGILNTSAVSRKNSQEVSFKPSKGDLAFLQYTSGSTGNPKGVMVTHENIVNNSQIIKESFEHDRNSFQVCWLPMFHDMGLIGGVIQPLYAGFPVVLMSPTSFIQKPFRWLKAISDYKATVGGGPNFAYELCVNSITEEQVSEIDLSSWKLAFCGAEPVRHETFQKFIDKFGKCGFSAATPYPCYGMAETTLFLTGGKRLEPYRDIIIDADLVKVGKIKLADESTIHICSYVSCGKVYGDHSIKIVNPETRIECADDEVGEVWTKGSSITRGYWNKADVNEEIFNAILKNNEAQGTFLRTGDLGFIQDGELYIAGRLKDVIIIRGRNYYPQDIERIVEQSHPALQENSTAAFAVEKDNVEHLVVVQELKRTSINAFNSTEIVKAIITAIVENFELQVSDIVLIGPLQIPKTSSGKIQRRLCREKYTKNTLNTLFSLNLELTKSLNELTESKPPAEKVNSAKDNLSKTKIVQLLTDKLSHLLSVNRAVLDPQAAFLSLGLDSMKAVRLSGEIQEALGIHLSDTIIYDYPTIDSLANYLSERFTNSFSKESLKEDVTPLSEPVAIIGMSCRFPGADNINSFWNSLINSEDSIGEPPLCRKTLDTATQHLGGYLKNIDKFDADFFGISPKEAKVMDPQQRIVLEQSYHALISSGLNPKDLAGSNTGVFIGVSQNDYSSICIRSTDSDSPYLGTGSALSIAANRLSYFYDLKGPSIVLDTACSSSLVAIHQAIGSIRRGETDLAIVGGVNLNITSAIYNSLTNANMLASDNRCKVFDSSADGYVRSEGCGFVILKPLSKALKDKDCIQAVIKGSAIEQDGRSNGLSAPNRLSQQNVIRKALADAQLSPQDLSFIETHGTGTKLGDPIEVEAIAEVYGKPANKKKLFVSAVKANIGHLESAAGIAGLIKAVLCLQNRSIPKQLHFKTPNPHIKWDEIQVEVPKELTVLQATNKPLRAGVSSFGFGGMNAHVILEEAAKIQDEHEKTDASILLTLSAKTENALNTLVERYHQYIRDCKDAALTNISYTANRSNGNYAHRFAVAGADREEILYKLSQYRSKKPVSGLSNNGFHFPKVAFLFTGQGSQYVNMGRGLYNSQPAFHKALTHCDHILSSNSGPSIINILFAHNEKDGSLLHQTEYTQLAIVAIEYALLKLWQSWGVGPDIVLGHSVGEYVAAVAAGVMRIEDALLLVYKRGQLMQRLPLNGGMAAVNISESGIQEYTRAYEGKVSVAAVNGPESIVIAGEKHALTEISNELSASGYSTTQLQVSHAFHSHLMEPMLADFADVARKITFNKPVIPLISTSTGELASDEVALATHWIDHISKPVLCHKSLQTLNSAGAEILVEVGPKPVLLSLAHQIVNNRFKAFLPSLSSSSEETKQMLLAAGELYRSGLNINWPEFYHHTLLQKVMLPEYPFQGESHWVELREDKPYGRVHGSTGKKNTILSLLENGDLSAVAEQIKKTGSLSQEKLELVPELLKLIAEQDELQSLPDSFNDHFYQVQWKPVNTNYTSSIAPQEHYLIFADGDGIAEKLAAELENHDCKATLVYASDSYSQLNSAKYQINPTRQKDFVQLIHAIQDNSQSAITHVIHLWSTDVVAYDNITPYTLTFAQPLSCGSVLHLVQSLLLCAVNARIWLVTRAAQAVLSKEKISLSASPLWGFGRVISLENPQLWGGMIDLDSRIFGKEEQIILQLITNRSREDHWAIRNQQAYVSRLIKQAPEAVTLDHLDQRATYVITGGLGALGLHAAEWMVEKGAGNIVLIGRSKSGVSANEAIDKLREKGGRITVLQGDVCKATELAKILEQIDNTISPVRGIIHAAGVADYKLIPDLTYADMEALMAPKVLGSWNLHQLTRNRQLDFFITYSSISSVWGAAGQAHYAAGNHFLDALASYRHSIGLPATNINWGPWSGGGMADRQQLQELSKRGLIPLSPENGIRALDRLVATNSNAIVAEVDWTRFKQLYEISGQRSLLNEIEVEPIVAAPRHKVQESPIVSLLTAAPVSEQKDILTAYLQKVVAQVLELKDPRSLSLEKGFADMGIDSLMAVELKRQIENDLTVTLPVTLTFEYPTIISLVHYLLGIYNSSGSESIAPLVEETNVEYEEQAIKEKIRQLSEKDAEDLINQELEKLV